MRISISIPYVVWAEAVDLFGKYRYYPAARNMAKALWVFQVTGEFGIPTVYKPSETIRTLRRLFATYNLLNRQIRMLDDRNHAHLPPALGANQRVDLIHLRQKPRPCPLPCVHGDLLTVIERSEAGVFRNGSFRRM